MGTSVNCSTSDRLAPSTILAHVGKFCYNDNMQIPREPIAIRQAAERLAAILEVPWHAGLLTYGVSTGGGRSWDAVLAWQGRTFGLEWRRSGSLAPVAAAIHELQSIRDAVEEGTIPILAVPYMGDTARERCADAGQSWLDLSGNGRIVASGIFYQNLGNPNQFRRPGRPESAFGPKGSRIARRLLMEPGTPVLQRVLASTTGLDEGYVSRVVGKLLETGLVERRPDGIQVTDPDTLLAAWRDEYRFGRHHVIRGHIASGAGISPVHSIASTLFQADARYAATALPAAWLLTRHAGYRLCTVYLLEPPSAGLKMDLGFRDEERGANTWLVVPNDEGVFDRAKELEGVNCVHPLQAYIDLKHHPERAAEAAEELRQRVLFRDNHDA